MRLGIIGSREFNNKELAEYYFETFFYNIWGQKLEIISGGAKSGGDFYAKLVAEKHKLKYTGFPAEWDNLDVSPCKIGINKSGKKYNILAGYNRNRLIIQNSNFILAFWINSSGGTKDSLKIAKELNIPTLICYGK